MLLCSYFLLQTLFFWTGRGISGFQWYAIPSSLSFVVSATIGLDAVLSSSWPRCRSAELPAWLSRSAAAFGAVGMTSALVAILMIMLPVEHARTADKARRLIGAARAITDRIQQSGLPDRSVSVAVGDIGVIGYRLPERVSILDLWGLVSPGVLRMKRRPSYLVPALKRYRPDFLVIPDGAVRRNLPIVTGYRGPLFATLEHRRWFRRNYRRFHTTRRAGSKRIRGYRYAIFEIQRQRVDARAITRMGVGVKGSGVPLAGGVATAAHRRKGRLAAASGWTAEPVSRSRARILSPAVNR